MQNQPTDQQIQKSICADQKSREQMLQHIFKHSGWRQQAHNILKTKGLSQADAADAVSEALIVFDRQIRTGGYDAARGSLKNYFLGIAVGLSQTARRSQKRIVLPETMPENDEPAPENPEIQVLDEERTQLLRKLLDQLDEHCRELLRMYKLSFSMREIAEKLQISSENLTRKQAHDCRQKLFKIFEARPSIKKYFDQR